jgi:hypothetical protein
MKQTMSKGSLVNPVVERVRMSPSTTRAERDPSIMLYSGDPSP